MKTTLFTAMLVVCGALRSQTRVDLKGQSNLSQVSLTLTVETRTELPAQCVPGQLLFLTTAVGGRNLYGCTATDTWQEQGTPGEMSAGSGLAQMQNGTASVWSVDSTVLPYLGLDNAFLGDNAFAGKFTTAPGSTQTLIASDGIDVSTVTVRPIRTAAALTMVATPTIASGDDGQHAYVWNAGQYDVTLQDSSKLPGSNLCLAGGANLVLAAKAMVHLVYAASPGCWIQAGGGTAGNGGGGAVSSVFGRTGAVVAQAGDFNTGQVTEAGNLYYTDARARAAFTAGTGISLAAGVISTVGVTTVAANSGAAGARVLKDGTNVTARRLVAGANVAITENTDDITISATGGGGGTGGLQRDFPAAVCQSAAGSLAWNVGSANAPVPDCVIGANGVIYGVAKFSNSSTQAMQQSLDLPASVSNVTFSLAWRALAAGGDVVWQVRYLIVGADGTATDDPDLNGTGVTAAAAAVTAAPGAMKKSSLTIAPANAGGKRIYFTVFRDNAHVNDTFTHGTYMPELAKVTVTVQ
ncbi:hypothetical protein [Paludibaculum fermentans]|uniref:Uncharacterized protein n=1 Tax=Paludibaculum fermentans TaxID=1473598 RepID=A0A7S7NYX8_PALFE|nr:hypothetical protein [Paludibaculum fermentans]QOY92337.1 hypothetical protein IRI77_37735 [Paludibaculum fermentans]